MLAAKKGVEAAGGDAILAHVPETLTPAIAAKAGVVPPPADEPTADNDLLRTADGIIFGFPTRYGGAASQMRAFIDGTGALWAAGALAGKPAACVTSTATIGSGNETTIFTFVPTLAHLGMLFVPAGYAAGPALFDIGAARNGSPWGAATLAGADGKRTPVQLELDIAEGR